MKDYNDREDNCFDTFNSVLLFHEQFGIKCDLVVQKRSFLKILSFKCPSISTVDL